MAFNGYVNYLNSKNTPIDRVITQMYFDEGVSYGKLFFSAIGFVDEESVSVLETLVDTPEIQEAITTSYSLINDEESKTGFVESNGVPKESKASLFTATDEPAEKPKVKARKKKDVPDVDAEELGNILKDIKNWGDEDNKEVDD